MRTQPITLAFAPDGMYCLDDMAFVQTMNDHPEWVFATSKSVETVTRVSELIDPSWNVLYSFVSDDGEHKGLYESDSAIIMCQETTGRHSLWIHLHGPSEEVVVKLMAELEGKCAPVKVDTKSPEVPVSFWYQSQHGPTSTSRRIESSEWADIVSNYTHSTRNELERLLKAEPPFDAGKIILLSGEPGTGKSHFIRSLFREWRLWADANYLADTEKFFTNAGDLMSIVLSASRTSVDMDDIMDGSARLRLDTAERYRVFLMEDTDEFLRKDAKDRTGQAMSRLLNIADGMIGQGLRTLFIITTNEPIEDLHPAVTRAGRCIANIKFEKLTIDEANDWLAKRDVEGTVHGATSLADLYDMDRKQPHIAQKPEEESAPGKTGQYL